MLVERITENTEYKMNKIYLSQKGNRKIYDAEFSCKTAKTAIKKMSQVKGLEWLWDIYLLGEFFANAEPNNILSTEYDSYTIELFEDSVYIAVSIYE